MSDRLSDRLSDRAVYGVKILTSAESNLAMLEMYVRVGEAISRGLVLAVPVTRADLGRALARYPDLTPSEQARLRALIAHSSSLAEDRLARERGAEPGGSAPLSPSVRWLIAAATHRLPPALRDRYAADFETDAQWIDGWWARLRFAIGLRLWTVPRLRRLRDVPKRA